MNLNTNVRISTKEEVEILSKISEEIFDKYFLHRDDVIIGNDFIGICIQLLSMSILTIKSICPVYDYEEHVKSCIDLLLSNIKEHNEKHLI